MYCESWTSWMILELMNVIEHINFMDRGVGPGDMVRPNGGRLHYYELRRLIFLDQKIEEIFFVRYSDFNISSSVKQLNITQSVNLLI